MLGLCGLAAGQMERVGRDDPLPLDQPHALIGAGPAAAPGKVERTEIGYGVARAQLPNLMCGAGSDHGEHSQGMEGRDISLRSEEHTSELQSLMRTSYAVFRLKKKNLPTPVYFEQNITDSTHQI